jgi:hypothetical protein
VLSLQLHTVPSAIIVLLLLIMISLLMQLHTVPSALEKLSIPDNIIVRLIPILILIITAKIVMTYTSDIDNDNNIIININNTDNGNACQLVMEIPDDMKPDVCSLQLAIFSSTDALLLSGDSALAPFHEHVFNTCLCLRPLQPDQTSVLTSNRSLDMVFRILHGTDLHT